MCVSGEIYLSFCRWREATDCKYLSFHYNFTILKVTTAFLEKESTVFSHLKINAKWSSVLGEKFMLPDSFPFPLESPCLTALSDHTLLVSWNDWDASLGPTRCPWGCCLPFHDACMLHLSKQSYFGQGACSEEVSFSVALSPCSQPSSTCSHFWPENQPSGSQRQFPPVLTPLEDHNISPQQERREHLSLGLGTKAERNGLAPKMLNRSAGCQFWILLRRRREINQANMSNLQT